MHGNEAVQPAKQEGGQDRSLEWIQCQPQRPSPRMRLFTFPFAGSGSSIFRTWHESLPRDVEICAVQLPGREARIAEEPSKDLGFLVHGIASALQERSDLPFAFFGHSFGSVVAFELTRFLEMNGLPSPKMLFLSARPAPHVVPRVKPIHGLPRAEFIELVGVRYKALPPQLLNEPEILDLVLPALQADIGIAERYHSYAKEAAPVATPILALGGTRDLLVLEDELVEWRAKTRGEFSVRMFEGGHFYLQDPVQKRKLLTTLSRELNRIGSHSPALDR